MEGIWYLQISLYSYHYRYIIFQAYSNGCSNSYHILCIASNKSFSPRLLFLLNKFVCNSANIKCNVGLSLHVDLLEHYKDSRMEARKFRSHIIRIRIFISFVSRTSICWANSQHVHFLKATWDLFKHSCLKSTLKKKV